MGRPSPHAAPTRGMCPIPAPPPPPTPHREHGNSTHPLWAVQMALNMESSNRSVAQCLTDRKCQPLGGGTAWATLRPLEGPGHRPIVAAMCSTSSSGMFHEAVPAADAVVSHVVAMLLAFDALSQRVAPPDLPDPCPHRRPGCVSSCDG